MKFENAKEQAHNNDPMIDFEHSVKREYSLNNLQEIVDNNQGIFPKVASKFELLKFIQPLGFILFENEEFDIYENLDQQSVQNNEKNSIFLKDKNKLDLINLVTSEVDNSKGNSKFGNTRGELTPFIDYSININYNPKLFMQRSKSDSNICQNAYLKKLGSLEKLENLDSKQDKIFKIENNNLKDSLSNENKIICENLIVNSNKTIFDTLNSRNNQSTENKLKPRKYSMINHHTDQYEHYQEDVKQMDSMLGCQNNYKDQNSYSKINISVNKNPIFNVNFAKVKKEEVICTPGKISKEERKIKIQKYLTKKSRRNFSKRTRYKIRKVIAERRIRKNGKFICKTEESDMKNK